MNNKKRPGHLTQYAKHAGIALSSAAEQLQRVGIDYHEPFDFREADRRREAARHADRASFSIPIQPDADETAESLSKDPAFAELQRRRELYRGELARLEFEERIGKLINKEKVEEEAFRVGRLV